MTDGVCDYGQCEREAVETIKIADPFGDMTMRACEMHAEHGIENRTEGAADD